MSTPRTELFVSWDEIQSLCTGLAADIVARGMRRDKLLAITRGGLFPAGLLARELNIKRVETVGVVTYDGQIAGTSRLVKSAAQDFLEGALIIDDLTDSGATMDFIRSQTRDCLFITVFAKPDGAGKVDLYARSVPQECWIRFPWDTRRQYAAPLIKD